MGNLGDSLNKHAKRLGISKQVEAVGVVEEATKEIEKFIPKGEFEVISFRENILKIATYNSGTSSEIRLHTKVIVDSLVKNTGEKIMLRIVTTQPREDNNL